VNKSIAVSGKGGTGKSTIASLIITRLIRRGLAPVLAIDSDPDANLGTLLGINREKTLGDLREEVLNEIKNFPAGMTKANYVEAGLHEIIEESKGFDLITMGRAEGKSCYCYLNNLIRKFIDDLSPSYPWVVIDNEAGLEHISRMTTNNVDALLIVVNENPLSFDSAERIDSLTETLGSRIGKKYAVTNMVKPANRERIRDKAAGLGIPVICDIPFDEKLESDIFGSVPVTDMDNEGIFSYIDTMIDIVGGKNDPT
jgi:CO dehydrogenase maturation factor